VPLPDCAPVSHVPRLQPRGGPSGLGGLAASVAWLLGPESESSNLNTRDHDYCGLVAGGQCQSLRLIIGFLRDAGAAQRPQPVTVPTALRDSAGPPGLDY
jgi:hypothetical protein